jgi:hypothetical protein
MSAMWLPVHHAAWAYAGWDWIALVIAEWQLFAAWQATNHRFPDASWIDENRI